MSEKLSLLDDSSDSDVELKINKSYATSYDVWRNKEELQKYKDLKKEEDDSESSSESEEEVPEFDEEFFRALSLVKGKDPRIYDKNFELFKNKKIAKKPKPGKQKPTYMKDYERNLVLERDGKFSDEDDDEKHLTARPSTYNEQQLENLKSFKEAVGDSDVEDSDDDLLQERSKTKTEEEAEEEDYVKWLKGEEKEVSEDIKKDMSYLKNYWNDPKLDEGEKFLRDYILNKRYLEKDDSEVPTYEELTSGMLSDDEKMIEEQEQFEHKYNFRFEEPDEEFIKRYPRTVGDSLRRADNRRKQKREEKAERRQREKDQRQEELKRLKALKRKEIEEKFLKLKEISGQDEINMNESDIESDFDPDKHDQKMREMFNDEYYQVEEAQKPEFPYEEELDIENWNAWSREKCEDDKDDGKISDDNEASSQDKLSMTPREEFADEMINASRHKKKGRKKSLFAKVISQTKPIYDPDGKSFEEYLDEYYKLDYEDVVGDLPVRYKYRKVIPNDFGLTVDEILAADDRELNRWCSVKKTCQYRNDDEELYDVQAFQKKAQNPSCKKKIFLSVYAEKDDSNTFTNVENVEVKKCEELNDSANEIEEVKDSMQCSTNDVEQTINKDSAKISGNKKKSKKKHKGQHSSAMGNEAVLTEGIDLDINASNLESAIPVQQKFDEVLESFVQPHVLKKKSKKKKLKEKHISSMEIESEHCNVTNEATKVNSSASSNKLSNLEENSYHKSTKRKRKDGETSFSVDDSDAESKKNGKDNILPDKLSSKSKHISYDSNNTHDRNFISESTKKPAKKKHKKNDTFNKDLFAQVNKSNSYHNKFGDKKHKQIVSEDKRLGLSDERLAAYGINPKKFKNKIIYSGK